MGGGTFWGGAGGDFLCYVLAGLPSSFNKQEVTAISKQIQINESLNVT